MRNMLLTSVAVLLSLLAILLLSHSWLEARDDRIRLAATLGEQKQLIDAADARERDRAAQLKDALGRISAIKRETQTPAQILRALPQSLPLPEPITQPAATPSAPQHEPAGQGTSVPETKLPDAVLPAADLKPLFDFVQDCRACQAQLAAARADLRDEQARSVALTAERDAALRAAKGGGFWLRLKRNAKWFALGAAAGAGITLAHTH